MTIKLFADSACDLPLSYLQENNITLLPLHVHIDDKNYEDLQTIAPEEVYKAIRAGKMPKTSQAAPELMKQLFTELAQAQEQGIYIAFSSALSGTYQTAVMVQNQVKEDYPDLDLTIIDSKCASLGYGLVVRKANELLQMNASKSDIVQDCEWYCQHMEHLFTVEDLDFLARGGRLSKASAFLGGLLQIKPLLHVEEGKLIPLEKIRGRKKLMRRMLDIMKDRGVDLEKQTIGISHGDDQEAAEELKRMIQTQFHTKNVIIHMIGSAIGSHSGPGTLALFFLNKTK